MSEFNAEEYVAKWDRIIGPIMLAFIILSIIAVYALNKATVTECTTSTMVYCGETASHHDSDH